jgi:aminoglycoside phosphotransferase (APT) family kinase protein
MAALPPDDLPGTGRSTPPPAEAEVGDSLRRLGLLAGGAPDPPLLPLSGGVSSDIWRVDLPSGPVCVKRARPRLAVDAHWEAPVERSHYEAAYLRDVATIAPGHVPRLLGEDADAHLLVIEWLDPATHRNWKAELLEGRVDPQIAEMVGRILVAVHAATAADPTIAERYDSLHLFDALRLEPYLDATASRHPDLAGAFAARRHDYLMNRRVLVHGDVSPKNLLVGPIGPVLLDAECATFGDPAFDLAFCLTHLLLKCVWRPASAPAYLDAFGRLSAAYVTGVTWEAVGGLERRVAALVPALVLARIDGKSRVEYLDEAARELVRRRARPLVARPPARLGELARHWSRR